MYRVRGEGDICKPTLKTLHAFYVFPVLRDEKIFCPLRRKCTAHQLLFLRGGWRELLRRWRGYRSIYSRLWL